MTQLWQVPKCYDFFGDFRMRPDSGRSPLPPIFRITGQSYGRPGALEQRVLGAARQTD